MHRIGQAAALSDWLDGRGLLHHHGSNGGEWVFFIFDRPPINDDPAECVCEGGYMVHRNSGKVGAAVVVGRGVSGAWLDGMAARGWLARVCDGADDAIRWLIEQGYGERA
jgi:hypothetical protein